MKKKGEKKLFSDFGEVSTETWTNRIRQDLSGTGSEENLIRRTEEEIPVKTFYRSEDLPSHDTADRIPLYRRTGNTPNDWIICQDHVPGKNIPETNKLIRQSLEKGAGAVRIRFDRPFPMESRSLNELLSGIQPEGTELFFKSSPDPELLYDLFLNYLAKARIDPLNLTGGIGADPLGSMTRTGTLPQSIERVAAMVRKIHRHSPMLKVLEADGALFQEAGSNAVQELAFVSAMLSEYLALLTGEGLDPELAFGSIQLSLCIGPDYFMEMSKLRASRLMFGKIAEAYGIAPEKCIPRIHATTSRWNLTRYDPHVNLLRATTQAMSAVLGGADLVSVTPFDLPLGEETDISARLARNLQVILREEAHLHRVTDPAAGAYYIEYLTDSLYERSWDLFCRIEDRGGYLDCVRSGWIREQVHQSREKKRSAASTGEKKFIGMNAFPNPDETIKEKVEPEKQQVPSFDSFRIASEFEELRNQTDRALHRPKVYLFKYGDRIQTNAKAIFAKNLFGCAGYEIIDLPPVETVEKGVSQALDHSPDVVVICTTGENLAGTVSEVCGPLGDHSIMALAGDPGNNENPLRKAGIRFFVHQGSSPLDLLKDFNKTLLKFN